MTVTRTEWTIELPYSSPPIHGNIGRLCDNESGPGGAVNTARSLTRSSDLSREGLAVKATRIRSEAV